MKRKFAVIMVGALLMALPSNVAFAAQSKIPGLMQPNSIIVYDDEGEPSVINGGYAISGRAYNTSTPNFNIEDYMRKIPTDATNEEREAIEEENRIIREALQDVKDGIDIVQNDIEIIPGMKVIYDENGELLNIYYVDDFCPEGYTLHGNAEHMQSDKDISTMRAKEISVTWGNRYVNKLVYQSVDKSILGTGRATYYTGKTGNRSNTLKNGDVATQITYDYSKKGDKDVTIRNLDTDEAYTFYQADVGGLPDAVIDIWELENLHKLAGDNSVTSVPNVRYYHKLFSDQEAPNW